MPVPSPRNKILPARGAIADLQTNVDALVEGEICYAIDLDQYYQKEDGVLVAVGPTVAQGELADSAVQTVNGKTGPDVIIDKSDIGLSNVDNTADIDKPISTSTQAALDLKADLIDGKVPLSQLPDSVSGDYLSLAPDATAQTVQSTDLTTFKGGVTSEGTVTADTLEAGNFTLSSNKLECTAAITLESGGTSAINFKTKNVSGNYNFFNTAGDYYAVLRVKNITANRVFQLPDGGGTIALTSDFSALPDTGDGNPQSGTLDDRYLMLTADAGEQTVESTGLTTFKGDVTSEGNVTGVNGYFGNFTFSGSNFTGTNNVNINAGGTGVINFKTKNSNSDYRFYLASGSPYGALRFSSLTSNRTYTFPDAAGTIALASDIPSVSGNYLSLASDAGDQNVLSTDVTSFAGKVGIGTDAPSDMLHVTDTDGVSRIAKFETTGTGAFIELKDSTTTKSVVIGKTGDDTHLYANDLKKLTVNSNGDVGIGTTAPIAKLAVVESDAFDPISDGSDGTNLLLRRSMDNEDRVEGAYGASITFTKINANNAAASIATVMGSSDNNQQDIVFLTHPGTSSDRILAEAMRITAAGNVGIGTTAPSAPLMFGKSVFGANSSEDFYRIKLEEQGGIENDVGFGQPETNVLGYNAKFGHRFYRGQNGEAMRIDSDGNVGIGTDDPDTLLHMSGDTPKLRIESTNSLDASAGTEEIGRLEWEGKKSSNLNVAASIRARQDGTWSTTTPWFSPAALEFYTQDASSSEITSPRLLIDSDGNVGVGTDNPQAKLHLAEDGGVTLRLQDSTGTAGLNSALISAVGTTELKLQASSGTTGKIISFYSSSTSEEMRIDSDGNVGIGTTDPQAPLHLSKINAKELARFERTRTGSETGAIAHVYFVNPIGTATVSAGSNTDDFTVELNNSEKLRITSGGNVGIGTTDPAQKLDVDGNIQIADDGSISTKAGSITIAADTSSTNPTTTDIFFRTEGSTLARMRNGALQFDSSHPSATNGVGICTTSTTGKLLLSGGSNLINNGINLSLAGGSTASPTRAYRMRWGTQILFDYDATADAHIWYANATPAMRLDTDGNVGIGTTDPTEKLEVLETVAGDLGGTIKISNRSTNQPGSKVALELQANNNDDRAASIIAEQHADGNSKIDLAFITPNGGVPAERMRIKHDGNVGIGVTEPTVPLDVNGTIKATGIQFPTATNNTPGLSAVVESNLLDDYEEGTFTPVITNGTASDIVYGNNNVGNYVKVGNLVTASLRLQITSGTLNPVSSNFAVSLPFVSYGGASQAGAGTIGRNSMLAGFTELGCRFGSSTTNLIFYNGNTVVKTDSTGVSLSNRIIEISITYRIK